MKTKQFDLDIAEALNLVVLSREEAEDLDGDCYSYYGHVLRDHRTEVGSRKEVPAYSSDMNAAIEAAEIAGLFGAKPGLGCVLFRHTPDGPYVIGQFRESDDEVVDIVTASTAPMAICLAIQKLKGEARG